MLVAVVTRKSHCKKAGGQDIMRKTLLIVAGLTKLEKFANQ